MLSGNRPPARQHAEQSAPIDPDQVLEDWALFLGEDIELEVRAL